MQEFSARVISLKRNSLTILNFAPLGVIFIIQLRAKII